MSSKQTPPELEPPPIADIEWSQGPYITVSGLCMGTADVVPGVSGGTMAVALGIYRRLLAAITSINVEALRALLSFKLARVFEIVHWRFLTCLLGGVLTAIIVMVKIVKLPHLITTEPTGVYAVFFGLVAASALVLGRRLPAWKGGVVLSAIVGTGLGFAIVNLVPVSTPETAWFVFLCGILAICAMLLPGISGSFILLILGKYEYVLGAVGQFDLGVILPFVLGCAVGITGFSRLLGWALDRYHDPMVAGLTGLLIGSLWRIWPYQHLTTVEVRGKLKVVEAQPFWPESLETSVVVLLVIGFAAVVTIERLAARRAATSPA